MKDARGLVFHNFGQSRSRIVLVSHGKIGRIQRISGTRWITTSADAERELRNVFKSMSYRKFSEMLDGGISSASAKKLRNTKLELPSQAMLGNANIYSFGNGGNRVVIVATDSAEVDPVRIGTTSWIATNSEALLILRKWFGERSYSKKTKRELNLVLDNPIGGGTFNRLVAGLK